MLSVDKPLCPGTKPKYSGASRSVRRLSFALMFTVEKEGGDVIFDLSYDSIQRRRGIHGKAPAAGFGVSSIASQQIVRNRRGNLALSLHKGGWIGEQDERKIRHGNER